MQLTFIVIAPFLFQLVIGVQHVLDKEGFDVACFSTLEAKEMMDSSEIVPGTDEPLFCPADEKLQEFLKNQQGDVRLTPDPREEERACISASEAKLVLGPGEEDEVVFCPLNEKLQEFLMTIE